LLDTLAQAIVQAEVAAPLLEQQELEAQQAEAERLAAQATMPAAKQPEEAEPEDNPDSAEEVQDLPAADEEENLEPLTVQAPAALSAMARVLPQVWVLELSSFQLDSSEGFEPTAATVLNVTQDHLDWHGSMQAYADAKARIFGQQGLMVLNREDATVMAMLPEPVRVKLQKPVVRAHTTFGLSMPQRPGDWGLEVVNGMAWLVRAHEADETRKRRKGEAEELFIQHLMPADALRIRGRHNASNALAALALASAAGCALAPMLYGLREYEGEPHRVQSVAVVNDIEFVDDSKGTNVGATVAALDGLGADRRLVVILGGDGKGQDFSPLLEPVQRCARAVVLIGKDAPLIEQALHDVSVPKVLVSTLQEAVQQAHVLAQAGDAVLLSPACASLDMFDNYAHRAKVFCDEVQELALASGNSMEGAL
jgi:UDP-N-acetylmuramoylalanine--D-glutamate ligase